MIITPEAAKALIVSLEFDHAPESEICITGSIVLGTTKGKPAQDLDFICNLADFSHIQYSWREIPHPTYTCKSFKKEILPGIVANAIVAHSRGEFQSWVIATEAVKSLQVVEWEAKKDRIRAFSTVLNAAKKVLCP